MFAVEFSQSLKGNPLKKLSGRRAGGLLGDHVPPQFEQVVGAAQQLPLRFARSQPPTQEPPRTTTVFDLAQMGVNASSSGNGMEDVFNHPRTEKRTRVLHSRSSRRNEFTRAPATYSPPPCCSPASRANTQIRTFCSERTGHALG